MQYAINGILLHCIFIAIGLWFIGKGLVSILLYILSHTILQSQIFVRHRVLRRISSGCSNPLCFAQVHTIRTRESAVRRNYSNQSRVEHSSSHIVTHYIFHKQYTTNYTTDNTSGLFTKFYQGRQAHHLSFLCKYKM